MPTDLVSLLVGTSLALRGRLRLPPDATHPAGRFVIVQGALEHNHNTRDRQGRPLLVCDYVPPTDRRTPGQLEQRQRLRRANEIWKTLTAEQRREFWPEAKRRRITPYNQAMSVLCRAIKTDSAPWDAGLSAWDGGATIWDASAVTWDIGATIWDGGLTIWEN